MQSGQRRRNFCHQIKVSSQDTAIMKSESKSADKFYLVNVANYCLISKRSMLEAISSKTM